jgi:hypothetical protein
MPNENLLMTDPPNWKAEPDAVLLAEHGPARMKEDAARLEVEFQYVLEQAGDSAKLGKSVTCRPVFETGKREKEEEGDNDNDSGTQGEERKPPEQDDEEDQEDDEDDQDDQDDDEGDEDQEDEEPWRTQSRRRMTVNSRITLS